MVKGGRATGSIFEPVAADSPLRADVMLPTPQLWAPDKFELLTYFFLHVSALTL